MASNRTLDEPHPLDPSFIHDPHRVAAEFREEGPPRPVVIPNGLRGWLVTRYADARQVLAEPRVSKNLVARRHLFEGETRLLSENFSQHMLNTDPPDHTRLRKLVNKAFTAKTVARLRPRVEEITDELLDGIEPGEVDLLEAFALPLPVTVISELLGVPEDERADFHRWSSKLITQGPQDERMQASADMAAYLVQLVGRKRAEPTDDLLSELVHVTDEGDRLSESELVSMAFLLLVAGHETTVNLIANGVLALLRHPDQLAALREDPSLLPNAVEEFLRFDGPINVATMRYTSEPIEVGGVDIPADAFVFVSLLGANRDAERFDEPDRLDIARKAGGHLAFGHGIHYCVGAPLARLEGEIAIGRLIRRFGHITLAGEPEALTLRESTLIHSLERLPVNVGGPEIKIT